MRQTQQQQIILQPLKNKATQAVAPQTISQIHQAQLQTKHHPATINPLKPLARALHLLQQNPQARAHQLVQEAEIMC